MASSLSRHTSLSTRVVMSNSAYIHTASTGLDLEKLPGESSSPENNASPETGSTMEEIQLSPSHEETEHQRPVTGFRWILVCVAIFSGNILYGLDTTIAADIQAAVSETYSNVTQLGWLGVGFCLGSTVTILPLGKAYARFDNKWVFIGCLTMFAAGSALCGGAPDMNAMIVGRVWAGAGGAGVYLGHDLHPLVLPSRS
ncbi:hypothetical protein XPA_010455 [Xanthoria parietina]